MFVNFNHHFKTGTYDAPPFAKKRAVIYIEADAKDRIAWGVINAILDHSLYNYIHQNVFVPDNTVEKMVAFFSTTPFQYEDESKDDDDLDSVFAISDIIEEIRDMAKRIYDDCYVHYLAKYLDDLSERKRQSKTPEAKKLKQERVLAQVSSAFDDLQNALDDVTTNNTQMIKDLYMGSRGTTRTMMQKVISLPNLTARAYKKLKTDAAKQKLLELALMPTASLRELFRVISTSGMGIPEGVDGTYDDDIVRDAAFYKNEIDLAIADDSGIDFPLVDEVLHKTPGEKVAYKKFVDIGLNDEKLGFLIKDPSTATQGVVITRHSQLAAVPPKIVHYYLNSCVRACHEVYLSAIAPNATYKDVYTEEDKKTYYLDNLYVPDSPTAVPSLFCRFSAKPQYTTTSTPNHKELDSVVIYCQKADKTKVTERYTSRAVVSLSMGAAGADKATVISMVNSTPAGKELLTSVAAEAVNSNPYEFCSMASYNSYYNITKYMVIGGADKTGVLETMQKFGGPGHIAIGNFVEQTFIPTMMKVLCRHLGLCQSIRLEMTPGIVAGLPALLAFQSVGILDNYIAIASSELIRSLKLKLKAADGVSGQSVNGNFLALPDTSTKFYGSVPSVGVKHAYDTTNINKSAVAHDQYVREGVVPLKWFTQDNTLVDLTVPGLRYSPQNLNKAAANESFKGEYMLIDRPTTRGLYTFDQLRKLKAFIVYKNIVEFFDKDEFPVLKELYFTHYLFATQVPGFCFMGVYLCGYRRDLGKYDYKRDRTLADLRAAMAGHAARKTELMSSLFDSIPSEPATIYAQNVDFITNWDLEFYRKSVGSEQSYKNLVTDSATRREKEFSDMMGVEHYLKILKSRKYDASYDDLESDQFTGFETDQA